MRIIHEFSKSARKTQFESKEEKFVRINWTASISAYSYIGRNHLLAYAKCVEDCNEAIKTISAEFAKVKKSRYKAC